MINEIFYISYMNTSKEYTGMLIFERESRGHKWSEDNK